MRPEAATAARTSSFFAAPRARQRHLPAAAAALCLLGCASAVCAYDDAARLAQVRAEIKSTLAALAASGDELSAGREQAFELERDIAAVAARQLALAASIARKTAYVAQLHAQATQGQQDFERARARLREIAVARYTLTLQPRLQLLLNQDDIRRLGRYRAYSDYLIKTYRREQQQAAEQIRAYADTEAALKLETNSLRLLRQETAAQLGLLQDLESEHAGLIAAIERRMNEGNARVEQLREDERQLSALLADLTTAAAPLASAPFAELKGRLAWPAVGRVASAAGTAFRAGGARWPGVFIETAEATAVTAVAAGRVVFADWFRNLGQLVIVDHGGGYMSLYGNNADIARHPGDTVAAGDTLAHAGEASGELPRGVYFELRADGTPLDPRAWCIAR